MSNLIKTDLSKNCHDRHLNMFWFYNGAPTLENNITKAMINTFDALSNEQKIDFLEKICKIDINYALTYKLYLQSAPRECEVERTPIANRKLIAFSPTGKSWGYGGIASNDREQIKEEIEKAVRARYDKDDINAIIEQEYNDTLVIIDNKGESIPDAWIMIYRNGNPDYCIAFENKLYDLNPYQLNNHCKKSLFLERNTIEYVKYSNIIDCLTNANNYIADEFVRYLFLLGYGNITNLSQLNGGDGEMIKYYATERIKDILNEIGKKDGKKAAKHKRWMWKLDSNNEYNKEIGFCYDEKSNMFELNLYFCTNQKFSRWFYSNRDAIRILNTIGDKEFIKSFHFQYKGIQKNVDGSYCTRYSKCPPEQYIRFWQDNIGLIRQSNTSERAELLEKMNNSGLIDDDEYACILEKSNAYDKKYNIVPEFGFKTTWTFDEAQKLDEQGMFVSSIVCWIRKIYNAFGISDNLIN